jgi:ABC-type cobalamin/Fe3+-siderophores transport system ATPase subunit
LAARAWQQLVRASAVPGYGYRYRRWVLDSLRYVDVQDLATGGDHIPELSDVYVDVALVSRAPQPAAGRPLAAAAGDDAERRSISGLLDGRDPVVLALVGQPGSGKSTLLAHAARRSARVALPGQSGRRRVPILLALREQAQAIVANPAISLPDVIRTAVGGAAGREPRLWWERELGRGRCLVLLDGLDEIARDDDRLAVADWIKRQVAAHPGNHFVITSRSFGLPGSLTEQADVLVVRPFTAAQVQLFLDRWSLAAERHATGASGRTARRAVRLRAHESAARLSFLLQEHPALRDLAANPLLLTMIATAHRYRGALPGSRADLYGEICQVLLSRRSQAKDIPQLLSWPAKQTLLAALAYQMMRDHVTDLRADRVLEILGPQLERFSATVTGEAFLADMSSNGLFTEAGAGRYAFTHLTFQEYLAARHVSATPDLVSSLADHVSDPWWHETILLYAATADASPIVAACLESGTIASLTLAFDCDEANAEIDPELRRRLDRERARAYEPGCPPEHRRLIAGAQAARLIRRTLVTASGTRICVRPVPADLYWIFLQDTQAPPPDSPCDPRADQPATGIWGTEARAFVKWLNSITATATGIEVRLPHHDELQQDGIAGALSGQLPATVTCAWTESPAGLWLRPDQPHPHELSGTVISQAIAGDARHTAILTQVLTAAVLDVALSIAGDLDDIRALSAALARDLGVRANSEGRRVELMHAHAHAIALTYAHALDLTRADVIRHVCAADPGLVRTLDLTRARALADAVAGDLAGALDVGHARAVELAAAIDLDLNVLGAFDFDVAHTSGLADAHVAGHDRAYALARSILHAPDLSFASVDTLHPGLPVPGVLGLPLRWVANGPLAGTLLHVLAANPASVPGAGAPGHPLPGDPYLAFAIALCSRAGIHETSRLTADLGHPLTEALLGLAEGQSSPAPGSPGWRRAIGLRRLTKACAPLSATHRPPDPPEAAALRAVALDLAEESAGGANAADVLRGVAATVTLIERRAKGEATIGESIILALA